MKYEVISSDSHIDLTWLPADLFVSDAPQEWKEKVPHVVEIDAGKSWLADGADLGGVGGSGFTGNKVKAGYSKHEDRMIETGFYSDGAKGIFRPTTPELRIKDQEMDGIHAEVIYGILGVGQRLGEPDLTNYVFKTYNTWVADFAKSNPDRFAALACIPNHSPEIAAEELKRAAGLGLRGADFWVASTLKPVYYRDWDPLWAAAAESNIPISFHTLGLSPREPDQAEAQTYDLTYRAIRITMFQLSGIEYMASVIFSGACDRYPGLKFVLGEAGISWIPYVLDRMDHEYDDRYYQLNLSMRPSEFWARQGYSTYQKEGVAGEIVSLIGEDNVLWGSDYPHPDGVWPDSLKVIEDNLGGLDDAVKRKITRDNAGKLYRFLN